MKDLGIRQEPNCSLRGANRPNASDHSIVEESFSNRPLYTKNGSQNANVILLIDQLSEICTSKPMVAMPT